ncbi:MAG TPA: hypothetical protein ENN68_05965 [Methanomicrobia archaeon]|nr:hypothetical protein [Methanomicrobia archaeon]
MHELKCWVHDWSVNVTELSNFGSLLNPLYTIGVELELHVSESPDALHRLLTDTGLVSRESIPFDVVTNFRGSATNEPYYAAHIRYDGMPKRYEVAAHDTGGVLRTKIAYKPVVTPAELQLHHPANFVRLGITVDEWELHNYKHYFMLLIASKRYECFDLWVTAAVEQEAEAAAEKPSGFTTVRVKLAESELKRKDVPCAWYVQRLAIFENLDVEAEVRKKLAEA